ncbi:MAG TPA: PAS domain-containing protein [Longimicrobium sp.]|jgi:PAS domain S-box-containing protein|uniref:PAS domain-containing protein n=1 Tax=Longimicrobium sp. TaxID=2029185 RepID=UPI002EDB2276
MQQTIFDNLSDGVLVIDAEGRIQEVNRRAETLFRKRKTELLHKNAWNTIPDIGDGKFQDEVQTAMSQGLVRIFEHFYPSMYVWHKIRVVPLPDDRAALIIADITEVARRQHTEAVREAVRNVVRQAPVAISIVRGPEHRFEVVNDMSRRLIGDRDLEGMLVRQALPELEGQGLFELLDEVYRTGEAYVGSEMPVTYDRTGEGEMVQGWFNVIYQPLYEADGRVSGVLSMSLDVTELVEERKAVEVQAARQRAILAQLDEGVVVADAEGHIRFINEQAQRMHGTARLGVGTDAYAREYQLFTESGEPYPDDQLPLARAVLHEETVSGVRWRVRRPDGSEVLLEGGARPVYADNGERLGAVVTMREV